MEVTKEKLLTVPQVAKMLSLHPQTLAAWRCYESGNLPHIKRRHRVFYREDAVRAYAKTQSIEIVEL